MSTKMIRLADAQAAIRYAIDYYERTVREILRKAADGDPDEELLIAAEAAVEGAKRAQRVRVYEAMDFTAVRIVDKKWIPEEMHSAAEEHAIKNMLHCVGETLEREGVLKTRKTPGVEPEQTRIAVTFTIVKPADEKWVPPEVNADE